jgi:hypothetical protein
MAAASLQKLLRGHFLNILCSATIAARTESVTATAIIVLNKNADAHVWLAVARFYQDQCGGRGGAHSRGWS